MDSHATDATYRGGHYPYPLVKVFAFWVLNEFIIQYNSIATSSLGLNGMQLEANCPPGQ